MLVADVRFECSMGVLGVMYLLVDGRRSGVSIGIGGQTNGRQPAAGTLGRTGGAGVTFYMGIHKLCTMGYTHNSR